MFHMLPAGTKLAVVSGGCWDRTKCANAKQSDAIEASTSGEEDPIQVRSPGFIMFLVLLISSPGKAAMHGSSLCVLALTFTSRTIPERIVAQ